MVSEPAGPSASDLTPSQHQLGMEGLGHLGTPRPLDHQNIKVVGGLRDKDEGEEEEEEEEVYEYAWSMTAAEDEAACACQYELDFDMSLFDDN